MTATRLFDRAVLRVAGDGDGEDPVQFLQALVTQDVAGALPVWAALLSPQGKALFDFFVWPSGRDLLLDCEAAAAEALTSRLAMYRLRRAIRIGRDDSLAVHWTSHPGDGGAPDPRLKAIGERWIAPVADDDLPADSDYRAHRLRLGVTEGEAELGSDATLWLECNAAELHGVSFAKGCYVGQENTARMNWRQKINRRLIVLPIARSDPARRRAAYPELGLAVDHRRVEDIEPAWVPYWLKLAADEAPPPA